MGPSSPPWPTRRLLRKQPRYEHLLDLQTNSVAPDGTSVSFNVQYTNQHAFVALIGATDFPAWFAEMKRAAALLISRQRLTLDRGLSRLLDLCDAAPLARGTDTIVDPGTGEMVLLFQFRDQAPLAVRLSAEEAHSHLRQITEASRVLAH